jgi:hypothetical protein
MLRKSLLSLHETMVVALINMPGYTVTFEEIAAYVEKRNLFPERKGVIDLAKQMDLRALKSKGRFRHLFEDLGADRIKLVLK